MRDAEADAIARASAGPTELTDLADLPGRLPHLTAGEIVLWGRRAVADHRMIVFLIEEEIGEEEPSVEVVRRAMWAEYFLHELRLALADELERRRTGVAPRAKGMH